MCLREDLDQKSSPRSNWAVWEYTRKSCARVVPRPLGDVPVGAYDSTRLSNIGIGHGAIDAGVGPRNRGLHPTTSLNERIVHHSKIGRSTSGSGRLRCQLFGRLLQVGRVELREITRHALLQLCA